MPALVTCDKPRREDACEGGVTVTHPNGRALTVSYSLFRFLKTLPPIYFGPYNVRLFDLCLYISVLLPTAKILQVMSLLRCHNLINPWPLTI